MFVYTWRSAHLCTRPGSGLCPGSGFLGFQPLWHWQMWHWHLQELPEEAGRLVEGRSGPCSLLGFIFWWRCQHPSGQQTPDCWGETIWVGHLKFLTSASFCHADPLWEYPVFHGDHGTKTRTVKAAAAAARETTFSPGSACSVPLLVSGSQCRPP